jgi:hypothetical protein
LIEYRSIYPDVLWVLLLLFGAILEGVDVDSDWLAIFPFAFLHVSITVNEDAITLSFVFKVTTNVATASWTLKGTFSMH